MNKYILLLLLVGCAVNKETVIPLAEPTSQCVTKCGFKSFNLETSCENLQKWEDKIVKAYGADSCQAFKGWKLLLVETDNGGFKINDKWVFGATACNHVTFLGTIKALPHEIGHILDCRDGVDQKLSFNHVGWNAKGYCKAIKLISKFPIKCEGE